MFVSHSHRIKGTNGLMALFVGDNEFFDHKPKCIAFMNENKGV